MKTKVQLYLCDQERKLALVALLKDTAAHERVIGDLESSLQKGDTLTIPYEIDARVQS